MVNLKSIDSVFILSSEQAMFCEQLPYYDFFFSFLHPKLSDNAIAISTMHDLAIYFYSKESPIINPESPLTYMIRHFVVKHVMSLPKLALTKLKVEHHITASLLLAAKMTNLFIDVFFEIAQQLKEEDLLILEKYSYTTNIIFDHHFEQYESYPQRMTKLKTTVYQQIRDYIELNEQQFDKQIVQIIRYIDEYLLDEKEFSHAIRGV